MHDEEKSQIERSYQTGAAMPGSGMQSMLAIGLVFAVTVIALAFYNVLHG